MRDQMTRFMKEFPEAKQQTFAGNSFGDFVRTEIPEVLYNTGFVNREEYLVKGSVGQGNWATIPWIAILNSSITTTPQEGVYIVYLLSSDSKRLYLSFNQGCTKIKNSSHSKNETISSLEDAANKIRRKINSQGFSIEKDIELGDRPTGNGIFYEKGDIFHTVYKADSLSEPVGYIAFGEFTEGSAQAFTNALDELYYNQGARKLIIDLRGNGGGIVDEAIQIVNLFVDRDMTIVETRGKVANSNRTYKTRNNPRYKDLPLVVLVDKNSASASEIVSGALQDLGRAKLIGQRTFGKGLVQNVRPVAYGGHIKVTTSKYYLPSGRCIQAIDYSERQKGHELKKDTAGGILPDIVLDDSAKVDVCYSLYINNHFFDYATRYHRLHDSIAAPKSFELSDAEIDDFCNWLETRGYKYETETSKFFDDMLKMAKHEDIDSATITKLEALEPVLKADFREAILRNKEEVKQMLGADIVLRYYYQKGQAAYQLRFDDELKRALKELQ